MTTDPRAIPGISGADLSALKYVFVKADGSDGEKIKVQGTSTATDTVGVLCPGSLGDNKRCMFIATGFAKVYAAEALEPFDFVSADASGHAAKSTANDAILGRYIPRSGLSATAGDNDAADGGLIDVLLFPYMGNLHP